jgi:hypothetical protein
VVLTVLVKKEGEGKQKKMVQQGCKAMTQVTLNKLQTAAWRAVAKRSTMIASVTDTLI